MGRKTFGSALNGVAEPHRRESHVGRISTVGSGGKSVAVTNMNNSQLRNLVPITPYGISSSPPTGLMAFVLVTDNSSNDGIVGVYDPNKPSCSPGNAMIYSSGGASVHCNGKSVLLNGRNVLSEIDQIKKDIEKINKKLEDIDTDINNINKDIENINTDTDGIKQDIQDINTDISGIKSDIKSIESKL